MVTDHKIKKDLISNDIVIRGVCIRSRQQVDHEYDTLTRFVLSLPEEYVKKIIFIFCDSKATHVYEIHMKPVSMGILGSIGDRFNNFLLTRNKGYNSILVSSQNGNIKDYDAFWWGDE